jgi:hypothetical protein
MWAFFDMPRRWTDCPLMVDERTYCERRRYIRV